MNLSVSFIQGFVHILISVIDSIITVALAPLTLLISSVFPSLNNIFNDVSAWLATISQYSGWAMDALCVPSVVIGLIATYYVFAFGVSMGSWLVKLGIIWYRMLVP